MTAASLYLCNAQFEAKKILEKEIQVNASRGLSIVKNNKTMGRIYRADLVDQVINSFGLTLLAANQALRCLEDQGKLFPDEDSGLVMFEQSWHISDFERRQSELQESWLSANELTTFGVIQDEERELRKFQKLQKQEQEVPQKK